MSPSACRSLLYGVEYKSGDTEERERERKQESRLVDILRAGVGERASEPILAHIFLSPPRSVFPRSVSSAVFLASYEQARAPRARWLLRLPSRSLHATLPLSPPLVRHRHLIQTLFTAEGGVFTITMRSPDGRRSPASGCVLPIYFSLSGIPPVGFIISTPTSRFKG